MNSLVSQNANFFSAGSYLSSIQRGFFSLLCISSLYACQQQGYMTLEAAQQLPAEFDVLVSQDAKQVMAWVQPQWWQNFSSSELDDIVDAVVKNNLNLANNARNLESAQLTLREAGFNLLPTPLVTLGRTVRDVETDAVAQATDDPLILQGSLSYNNILSKPTTYSRAQSLYSVSEAQYVSVMLNTLGTTASTYFQLLFIRDQLRVGLQNLENAESIYKIVQAQVEAGIAVPINALNQQISVETQRANLRQLEQREFAALAALALLRGQTVQDFKLEGQTLEEMILPTVRPGLPSELLRRRPDLVQAEANVAVTGASVELAYLNLFPQISLTANNSLSSGSLSALVDAPDSMISITASLVQTLLDNGARYRNLAQQRLLLDNTLASYRQIVLNAFNEVEVQLNNIEALAVQRDVAERNLMAAEEAFRLAQARYREGVTDYQTVLTSQNSLFSTRNVFYNSKLAQLNAVVDFYQTIGGGWTSID
jgi:multidrug efflux system outer membrane protein